MECRAPTDISTTQPLHLRLDDIGTFLRHHNKNNLQKKEFIRGLKFLIMAGSMTAKRQARHRRVASAYILIHKEEPERANQDLWGLS